jgi:hypothetical protein
LVQPTEEPLVKATDEILGTHTIRMTSGGNLSPANAELGGWMGRMRRRCFTRTASSNNDLGSSPNGSRRDRAQCNSAVTNEKPDGAIPVVERHGQV